MSETEEVAPVTVTGADTEAADCPEPATGEAPGAAVLNWSLTAYTYSPAGSVPPVVAPVVVVERGRIDLTRVAG